MCVENGLKKKKLLCLTFEPLHLQDKKSVPNNNKKIWLEKKKKKSYTKLEVYKFWIFYNNIDTINIAQKLYPKRAANSNK